MKKVVIGILATSNYMVTNDTFQDTYRYGNNYIKKIVENGGVPLLIPYVDEDIIEESLEMCDGLLLPGGSRIRPVDFRVLDYFYRHNKPVLGICMGMQTIAMYSLKNKKILKQVDNHWPVNVYRDNQEILVHDDLINKNSKLYKIFNNEKIRVNSLHHNVITEVGEEFDISIRSDDDLIEGIEYKGEDKFIVGVQFHPEILPQFNNLFKVFIEECQKRK